MSHNSIWGMQQEWAQLGSDQPTVDAVHTRHAGGYRNWKRCEGRSESSCGLDSVGCISQLEQTAGALGASGVGRLPLLRPF